MSVADTALSTKLGDGETVWVCKTTILHNKPRNEVQLPTDKPENPVESIESITLVDTDRLKGWLREFSKELPRLQDYHAIARRVVGLGLVEPSHLVILVGILDKGAIDRAKLARVMATSRQKLWPGIRAGGEFRRYLTARATALERAIADI